MEIVIISAIWCPSCLVMKKTYKELENKFNKLKFTYLDYDFDEDVVKNYNVKKTLPILIIKQNELEVERIIGEHSLSDYEKVIKEFLNDEKN